MKYILIILLLLVCSRGFSNPDAKFDRRTSASEAHSMFQPGQISTWYFSAYIDDDSETTDGLEYDLFVCSNSEQSEAIVKEVEYIIPEFTLHRINLITPFLIDLPPPTLLR